MELSKCQAPVRPASRCFTGAPSRRFAFAMDSFNPQDAAAKGPSVHKMTNNSGAADRVISKQCPRLMDRTAECRSCWKRIADARAAFDSAAGCVCVRAQVEPSPTVPPPRTLQHMPRVIPPANHAPVTRLLSAHQPIRARVEPSPTVPPPRTLLDPRWQRTRSHSTGSCALQPISTPPGARGARRRNTSMDPTGSDAPAPTAAPPGDHPQQHLHTSSRPTGRGA